ncbi:MAG: hypothetical protein Q8S32_09485 [Burkholderiaceae bacterium]|nr:hypothetical protein [Burkholderiaceae bacterium]MDP3423980.1 hypothetical protein [Burkholderiaceae bacterium]MDZ4160921.1 hypothetical protein [Burkholderiales bacterium]
MQTLTQTQFQAAFAHGAIESVGLVPIGPRFAVEFVTRTGMATLVQARGATPRLFGTTDSALKLLHKLGVRRIVLDKLDEWQPEQAALQKRSRPDRAQALSRAAEYDRWVNAKVQSSRDDPRPAVADAEWQAVRQAKLAQRQALQAG